MSGGNPTIMIQQSLIDDICSVPEKWAIMAYDNDVTPFQLVFWVLKTVVPLSDREAFEKTHSIHFEGKAVVYEGSKEHCQAIGHSLDKIKVEYKIY